MRLNTKKVKSEIDKLASTMNDPVSLLNQDRGVEISNRMRETEN